MPQLGTDDPRTVGNYEIVSKLGEGGMGTVYKGRSRGGRSVAVKLAKRELAESPEFRQRFRTEIEAAQRVGGFHTAQVIDADPDGRPPWMVTAFIPGPTLGNAVLEEGPMVEPRLRALGAALAEALHAIHTHELIHRDLKPANIILADDGPRVLDFGVARALQSSGLTNTRVSVGTPGFWAPEQVVNRYVGPPADVFALGAVLVFAAGGSAFGEGDSMALMYRALHEEPDLSALSESLRPLVASCLAKDAARRPTPDRLVSLFAADAWTSAGLPVPPPADSAAAPAGSPASQSWAYGSYGADGSYGAGGLYEPSPHGAYGDAGPPAGVPAGAAPGVWPEPAAPADPRVAASYPPPTVQPQPSQPSQAQPESGQSNAGQADAAQANAAQADAGPSVGAAEAAGTDRRVTFERGWKARLLRGVWWLLLSLFISSLPEFDPLLKMLLGTVCLVMFLLAIRPFEVVFDGRGVRCRKATTKVDYAWADISQVEFPHRRKDGSAQLRLFVRSGANLPQQRPWLAVSAPHRNVTYKLRGKGFPYDGMREAATDLAPESVVVSAP